MGRYVSGPQLAKLLQDVPAERPYYAALARAVRRLILDGRLPLHTRLPAERDLATALGVSRTTVTAVYDALRTEGFVASRQGAGSWTALPTTTTDPATGSMGGAPPFGAAYRPESPDLIDLGCAALGAPRILDEAVAAAAAQLPRYTSTPGYEPTGILPLREAVAAQYAARGLPTSPDQIVVTTGGQQALALLFQTLTGPGDPVLVESPTFPHALDALRQRSARLVPTGVIGGWDVGLVVSALRQSAARLAYLIPDFQNPTGLLMSEADRADVLAAARGTDARIITDETFAGLALDSGPVPPPLACFDTGNRVISVGSMSKLFWGGLRLGWIRTTVALAQRLAAAREWIDIASPVLEQLVAAELLSRSEEVRGERVAQLTAARDAVADALRELLPDWEFVLPRGGMSMWIRLPAPVSVQVADGAMRRGVRIVPGPAFGADGLLDAYLRIPYVLPPDVLREAVERLAAAYRDSLAAPAPRSFPAYV